MEFDSALAYVIRRLASHPKRRYSARTIGNYERNVRRLHREIPGGLLQPYPELVTHLTAWRTEQQGRRDRDEISYSKIHCDVAALRCFYDCLAKKGYETNPAREIDGVPRVKGLPRPMPLPLYQQLAAVIATDTVEGLRDRVMIELMGHGLRNFEIGGIDTDAVLFDGETVQLKVYGKGNKERLIFVHPEKVSLVALYLLQRFAAETWRDWITVARVQAPEADDRAVLRTTLGWLVERRWPEKTPLFVTEIGTRCSTRWTNRMFVKYRDKAGLSTEWGPHSLRHTCATEMLDAGEDIAVVKEWLGHEKVETTLIYTKVQKNRKLTAIGRLSLPTASVEVLV